MRLTLFLLILGAAQLFAEDSYAQSKKFSLDMENVKAETILDEIENLSEFYFLYNQKLVDFDFITTAKFKNKTIFEALDILFKGRNITYQVVGRQIILSDSSLALLQQQKTVTGKVVDENGEPVPGASIVVKGTTTGTISDMDGNFTLAGVPEDAILQFSFVGMRTVEVEATEKDQFNIVLQEEALGLDEVVVVGYGTTTRRKMVSSVTTIETDEIADAPYSSVMSGLAGRASGLFVRESGGQYGSLPTISIRGGGEPTYVIDGIIASAGEFSRIPPEDIEDISFLKDASAAAVYGFNSANGVVLVTTQSGKKEGISITYSGNLAVQKTTLIPEYLSPYEKAVLSNDAAFYDGLPQIVDDETLDILKNNREPLRYPTASPFDMATKDLTSQQRHNIGLNGTIDKTSIYMSLDYFDQDGLYKVGNHGLNRYSFRSNITQKFDKIGLDVTGNISLQRQVMKDPPAGTWTVWSHVRNWGTGTPLYNPEGNYTGLENPIAEADPAAGYIHNETNNVNTRMEFNWALPWVEGLSFKALGNYRFIHSFGKSWYANQRNSAPIYSWDNELVNMGKPSLSESTGRSYMYDLEAHVYYTKTFADTHTFELTGVYSQREDRWDGFNAYRKDFVSPAVDQLFAGSAEGKDNSGNAFEYGRVGYIGRLKYDYKSKYILEGNFRYDGNDNFPSNNRWGFFPSLSVGWNLDQESFIKPLIASIRMTSLKLRASWGRLGSDDGVGRFAYIPVYNLNNNVYYVNGAWVTGFSEGNLVSSELSWYERESQNIALDFGFLDGKISGSVDWFYYRTTGYLASPSDRYTTPLGMSLPQINTNSAHRRGGVEVSAVYKAQIGEAKVSIGANVSYFDQLWEKKFDEDSTSLKNPYKRLTHQKDYYTIGYINEGYYDNMEEIINSPRRLGSTETKPGDLKYKDVNNDGRIDGDDQVRIGKGDFPHIIYGINLGAEYKGFVLNALFQGTSNRQAYLGGMWRNELNHKLYKIQDDSWKPDNRDPLFPRTSTINNINGGNNNVTSSFWLIDAWYLRMKSLSLSYNLKTVLFPDAETIDRFTIILSGTNLFTISPLNKYYMDPETSSFDNYGYPVQRTLNIGARITF